MCFEGKSRRSTEEHVYTHARKTVGIQGRVIQMCPKKGIGRVKRGGPYVCFAREKISYVRKENPDCSFGDISKLLGQRWKELSEDERAKYKERAMKLEDPDYEEAGPGGNRRSYMGSTPSKSSSVGQTVISNMLEQNIVDDHTQLFRDNDGRIYLQTDYAPNQKFYLDDRAAARQLHMGHRYGTVTFWNEIGRHTGVKSDCVRSFMHDPNNYLIQYGPRNCQLAPHEGYLPPVNNPNVNFQYEPCKFPGDTSNFDEMKNTLKTNGYI